MIDAPTTSYGYNGENFRKRVSHFITINEIVAQKFNMGGLLFYGSSNEE